MTEPILTVRTKNDQSYIAPSFIVNLPNIKNIIGNMAYNIKETIGTDNNNDKQNNTILFHLPLLIPILI